MALAHGQVVRSGSDSEPVRDVAGSGSGSLIWSASSAMRAGENRGGRDHRYSHGREIWSGSGRFEVGIDIEMTHLVYMAEMTQAVELVGIG